MLRGVIATLIIVLASPALAAMRSNVLFVLVDDMGYGDLSCFGGMRAPTPSIDQLARDGMRFTQFYANAPICSPSRVAFTTGQYPMRWRITSFLATRKEDKERGIADWLDPAAPCLARYLQQAGYHTAHIGKWHMGGQRDVADAPPIANYGFNMSVTNFEGPGERILPKFADNLDHGPTKMSAALGGGPIHWVEREKVTAAFVDRAIAEIDAAQKQDKPFYINLWPDDMHSPVSDYAKVLAELDRQLGRVFDRIKKDDKLRDNTFILLCSDNGHEEGFGTSGGLRGSKGMLYEGGIKSPLIVWAPKLMGRKKAGTTNDRTVLAGMDFPPTILSLCGVDIPLSASFDGMDMSDTFLGKRAANRFKFVVWQRPPDRPGPNNDWPDLAIRRDQFKLLAMRDGSRSEMYDILNDPGETTNLITKRADQAEKLTGELLQIYEELKRSVTNN